MTTYEYEGRIFVEIILDERPAHNNCTHLMETSTGKTIFDVPNDKFVVTPRRRPNDKLRRRLFDRPELPIEK